MALEVATYINGLDANNPVAGDPISAGDDHIRLLKSTIKSTFVNVTGQVTPTHTELNYVDGVTSAIQTQLDAKAPLASPTFTGTVTIPSGASIAGFATLASPTFTGTPAAPTAAAGTNTTQVATTAYVQTEIVGAWDLIKTSSTGTGATFELIHGSGGVVIDSTYSVYLIELIAVKPSADGAALFLRTTTDATNFDVGASDYQNAAVQVYGASPVTGAVGSVTTHIALAGSFGAGTAAGEEGYYGTILMWNPSAAAPCMFTYDLGYRESNAGSAMRLVGTAFRAAAANVDGLRFLWNTGNFASGTINLYGRRK